MTAMFTDDLRNLGLPKNSALVMNHLLHSGETKANEIVKKTGVHRHLIYEALRDLESRKLVKKLSRGGVAHFRLLDASSLVRDAERKHEKALEIARSVKEHVQGHESTVEFFEGVEGIDAFMNFVLEQGKPIYLLGANISFRKVFPEIFGLWNDKRQKLGMHIKALVPHGAPAEKANAKKFTYRFIDVPVVPNVVWVFGDYVAHVHWITRGNSEVVLIKNPTLAKQQRSFFRYMWDKAKK